MHDLFFRSFRIFFICLILTSSGTTAQDLFELNQGWKCIKSSEVDETGENFSISTYSNKGWKPAVVPGTVLTTQLENGEIPDPFYGMNNEKIPDIHEVGIEYYTYWFVNDFQVSFPEKDEEVWLHLRGVNYSCNIFLNGAQLNRELHKGMFLRQTYNISDNLNKNGKNRLAVIVYPPDPPGHANGGQGGDGTIAKNLTHQYVAGWDWIQPVRDRNTGIWDKVFIERTGKVRIKNPHVVTKVPGVRFPGKNQSEPALIKVSAELENPTTRDVSGMLKYNLGDIITMANITVPAQSSITFELPDLVLKDPDLWWPNGYGDQPLYNLELEFLENNKIIADKEVVRFGIREITTEWNPFTRSRQIFVNGQKIFIKGGNWIISDAMLRFSKKRYDAEIRFHRDMNLNLIRIWGGAITERPEFYDACDKYGILVMQDFWMSGDCNGRWNDRRKKEDQWIRRQYPDDHDLLVRSLVDQVKMIRNHPSLAFYCGGNEITPPEDVLPLIQDTLSSNLDGTRWFVESSTSDNMSYNFKGGVGDGPYSIQSIDYFWENQTFPFNSEIGSVGMGDYESLKRFLPDSSMIIPGQYKPKEEVPERWRRFATIEPNWRYHKFSGYRDYIDAYGEPESVEDFAWKAQLVNYNQYRALVEGFSSHMWEWYTGFIIWKTQNPWSAMRGQMYDCYLDPNASLYGLHKGSEPVHIMCNPVTRMVMIVNNSFTQFSNLMLEAKAYDFEGNERLLSREIIGIDPATVKKYNSVNRAIQRDYKEEGVFLSLKAYNMNQEVVTENLYWLPDSTGTHSGLQIMPKAEIQAKAQDTGGKKIRLTISNAEGNPLAFFMRISLVDPQTKERLLPAFYSNNYVSVEPGGEKRIEIDLSSVEIKSKPQVHIKGWNVEEQYVIIE
ncbi:glycoside hydrolase family 2 TIM barrel-domain containing protein [Bacteroidota bacterium]